MKRFFELFKCLIGALVTNAQVNAMHAANESALSHRGVPYSPQEFSNVIRGLHLLERTVEKI